MKTVTVVLCLFLALMLAFAGPSLAAEMTMKLIMTNITCARTAIDAQLVLTALDGVLEAEVDMDDYFAIVTFDNEKTTIENIKAALEKEGFSVKSAESVSE